MKRLTRWIAAKLIRDHERTGDLKVRAQYGALEGWTSIIVNVILFGIKFSIGLSIQSVSLIADAAHTLADSATSLVVVICFKIAKRPPDKRHPFGHDRMESIAALIVSVLLFVAAFELLQGAVHRVLNPAGMVVSSWVIAVIIGTVLVKEFMARFAFELGDLIDSDALRADALHHRSDVVATALVVVALVASRFGYDRVDGVMGVAVSLIIGYCAYSIAEKAVDQLLGAAPSPEKLARIHALARARPDVLGVHDIILHKYGRTNVVSLHIEVSDGHPAAKHHQLAEEIEEDVSGQVGGLAIVHVDPVNRAHERYGEVRRFIENILSRDERADSLHDLRLVGSDPDAGSVLFDIVMKEDAEERDESDIVRVIQERFRRRFPRMRVVVRVDPKFVYNP